MLLMEVSGELPRQLQISIAKRIQEDTGENCTLLDSGAVKIFYVHTKKEREKEKQEFWENLSALLEKTLKESRNTGEVRNKECGKGPENSTYESN